MRLVYVVTGSLHARCMISLGACWAILVRRTRTTLARGLDTTQMANVSLLKVSGLVEMLVEVQTKSTSTTTSI